MLKKSLIISDIEFPVEIAAVLQQNKHRHIAQRNQKNYAKNRQYPHIFWWKRFHSGGKVI